MADADDRRALWATPLEEQRRQDAEAERLAQERRRAPAPAPDPVEPPPGDPEPEPARRLAVTPVAVLLFAAAVLALLTSLADRGRPISTTDLTSYWEEARMTCATARVDGENGRRVELFRCTADAAGALPPGVYRSPETQWTSDYPDRRPSRASRIVISPTGVLTGWARY